MSQWQELNYRLPWSKLKIRTAWSDPNFSKPWSKLNFSPSWSDPNFNCLHQWKITQLSVYVAHSQLPNDSFLKSSNSQDHHFRATRHSHSGSVFYLRFIMTIMIVISFANERKSVPNAMYLNKEPNSSKPNHTEL